MMKKIIYTLLLLIVINGCSDFLERNHPTGITDEKFWKTTEQAQSALNQCMRLPSGTIDYGEPRLCMLHLEGMTDNMYFSANYYGEFTQIGNGSVLPTTGGIIQTLWDKSYMYIRRCNRFLEHVDEPYFNDEKERERMRCEARIWRAYYHINLLMYYGGENGIPIIDKALSPDEIYKPRNTLEECLTFINKEFDEVAASGDIPFIWDDGRRARMSVSDLRALQMRVNLQYHKYEKAKACALELINSDKFELFYTTATDSDPGKNYRDLFRYIGEKNKERIIYRESGLSENWFRSMSTLLGGQATGNPLRSLIDTYETLDGKSLSELSDADKNAVMQNPLHLDRDPRLFATVMLPGDSQTIPNYTYTPFDKDSKDAIGKQAASRTGYLVKKFLDLEDESKKWSGSLDFMIIRYAEVLLTYVECLVESGQWNHADVVKYLNMIRNRAGMPNVNTTTYNSETKMRELYQRERRVELCFEGTRYFDIRRWGIAEQVMKGKVYGAYDPIENTFVAVEDRQYKSPKNDHFPLPQKETTANPNISQPKGW